MRLLVVGRSEAERRFDRHYAEQHAASDTFCYVFGIASYLALLPATLSLRRFDLVMITCASAVLCTTLRILSRCKHEWYLRRRDAVLLIHLLVHALVSGMLMLPLTLSRKLQPATPAVFLAAALLGSSVPWHCLNALLCRVRFLSYIWMRPLILAVALPYEWALCGTTCSAAPGSAHAFGAVASNLRRAFALFLPFPTLSTAGSAVDSSVTSCFKLQAFLLLLLGAALPALIQLHFEKQMQRKYVKQCQLLVLEDSVAAAYAVLEQEAAAAAAASAASVAAATAAGPEAPPVATLAGAAAVEGDASHSPRLQDDAAALKRGAIADATLTPVAPEREITSPRRAGGNDGANNSHIQPAHQQQGAPPKLAALHAAALRQWREQQEGEEEETAPAHGVFARLAFHQKSGSSVVLLMAVLCWHVVDALF